MIFIKPYTITLPKTLFLYKFSTHKRKGKKIFVWETFMSPVSLVFHTVVTVKIGCKNQLEWDIHSIELDVYWACVLCNREQK